MAKTKSKTKSRKKQVAKVAVTKKPTDNKKTKVSIVNRLNKFLARRPHRSFRLTRRRDYSRSLELPGYFAFTKYVISTLLKYRKTFGLLALLSAVTTVLMVGIASQDTYSLFKTTIDVTSGDLFSGALGEIGKAGLLFVSSATGGISQTLTEVQQVYAIIITVLTWLVCVWLLRNLMAGHDVKLRDGVYSAGAPIVSTFIITLILTVQLLPLALAAIGYGAASASGLLAGGVEAMLFWIAASLLAALSLYWITSTVLALTVVTLPGMYPLTAMRVAGDMVVGRRLRVMYRLLWAALNIVIVWTLVMIPTIIIDSWVKNLWSAIEWFPTIPITLLVLSTLTVIFSSGYVYLLYRKVVADDDEPV